MKKLVFVILIVFSLCSCNGGYHNRRIRRTDDIVEVYDYKGGLIEKHLGHISYDYLRKNRTYDIIIYENGKDSPTMLSYSVGLVFVKVQRGQQEYELVEGKANCNDGYFD